MFHSVIICTRGRPQICRETIQSVLNQQVRPDQVIISASEPADVSGIWAEAPVQIVYGPAGSCVQRNRGFDALDPRCEIVSILDDDVELARDFFQRVQKCFADRPDVVLAYGNIRDLGGQTREQARRMLNDWPLDETFQVGHWGIGCSMNVRRSVVNFERFDERLALYGKLEDADFAARCKRRGNLGIDNAARLVHLVVRGGRTSGKRYGFSQIMNPFYLWRKGTVGPFGEVLMIHWIRPFFGNMLGPLRRDQSIDWWGRWRGNLIAFGLLLRGRVEPEYVEKV